MAEFEVIAHRGASRRAPENTLPALREAIELGVASVEIDAQLSRDGVAVLFHDRLLRHKTGAAGRVRDHPAAFLQTLDIGRWFDAQGWGAPRPHAGVSLATLRDALDECGDRLRFHIELKSGEPDLVDAVVRCVEKHGLVDRVALTSFSAKQLARAARLAPDLPRWWLLKGPLSPALPARALGRRVARAAGMAVVGVGVPAAALSPTIVDEARGLGLRIRAWGVRDDGDVEKVIQSGADGLTADQPERALALVTSRARGSAASLPTDCHRA